MVLNITNNIYGLIKYKLPFQGAIYVLDYIPRGVAIGLNYNRLSAKSMNY